MNLVCFTEEKSAKEMLQVVLPKILPSNYCLSQIIPFEGKSDLDKQIEKKLKNYNTPDTVFLILRDQDNAICTEIKNQLLKKIQSSGRENVSIVRIACHELESFYLGDLLAVEQAFGLDNISKKQEKNKYKDPDNLSNAKQELKKLVSNYQPISGSKLIAPCLNLGNNINKSTSFNTLLSGVQKLCTTQL
ncbi:hypothetical protein BSPWISOX_2438 [uncultured Gammaproteobacteria bacterium]|jgi:hypothetical protein|nr:hypothetical protein BSPWISOX_2438 [uncultured Gammaproteobacteria bacterium]